MLKSDVLNYFGTKTAIAHALQISASAVTQWKEVIPEKQAYRLELITKGALKVNPTLYHVQQP